jgi:hypothetical protein
MGDQEIEGSWLMCGQEYRRRAQKPLHDLQYNEMHEYSFKPACSSTFIASMCNMTFPKVCSHSFSYHNAIAMLPNFAINKPKYHRQTIVPPKLLTNDTTPHPLDSPCPLASAESTQQLTRRSQRRYQAPAAPPTSTTVPETCNHPPSY